MTREERELVLAAIDGSLPAGEEGHVRDLLKRDPAALELYAREALIHGELEWHFKVGQHFQDALRRRAELVAEARQRQVRRIATASLGVAAAALIVFAAVAIFQPAPLPAVGYRFNDGAVSQIVRAAENPQVSGFAPGDRMVLERGAVELTFPKGVRAVIKAPAEMEFTDGNGLRMDRGVAFFSIERPQAVGFTVTLPESEVVDLGTRFGIIARAGDPTEIHLIEGRVRAKRRGDSFKAPEELQPGEAYREDDTAATGFGLIPFDEEQFPRELPGRYEHMAINFDRIGSGGGFEASGSGSTRVREVIVGRGEIARVPGRLGEAARFDGSGSHVEIQGWPDSQYRPFGTLSFWIRLPGKRNIARYCPVSWGTTERADAGRWSVAIEPSGETAGLAIRAGVSASSHLSSSSRLDYGSWHHLAFVFGPVIDGSTEVRTFIDGREDTVTAALPVVPAPAEGDTFVIGTHLDPALWRSHAISADIDELRIYRAALDGGEIAALARGEDLSE